MISQPTSSPTLLQPRDKIGFIIVRCVNSEETNKYWIECYNCIRKLYNYKIIIIDDNSDPKFLKISEELINCEVIQSEYPKRGELLAYYYFYKNHFFEKAIIIHDSLFIQKKMDFEKVEKVKFITDFVHDWDNNKEEIDCLKFMLKNNSLLDALLTFYHKKSYWYGCQGVQSVIEHSFLSILVNKYDFLNLMNYIDSRTKRMSLERIFALICTFENDDLTYRPSIFGSTYDTIDKYTKEKGILYNLNDYIEDKKKGLIDNFFFIKVFTGR